MHKKIENLELDIPKNDLDCWERYPKQRWVYDASRVLDAQNIKWQLTEPATPFEKIPTISLKTKTGVEHYLGYIYTDILPAEHLLSEVYIVKGEVKFIRQLDFHSLKEVDSLPGQLDLKINALVALYFQKFTGVISMEVRGTEIIRIQLRPSYSDLGLIDNQELIKLIKRIYRKTEITLSGLTDRVLHETLAS